LIHEVLIDDRLGEHRGLGGFLKTVSILRQKKFNLAIIYHTKKRTNLMCFLAGIPVRLGYKNNKWGFLLTHPVSDERHLGKKHEVEYCLELLKTIDVPVESIKIFVPVKVKQEDALRELLKKEGVAWEEPLIAIHPGASDPSKCWPTDSFAQLIGMIRQANPKVRIVLVGAENIKSLSRAIVLKVSNQVIDLTGKTSIGLLLALFKHSRVLVSNDSGPVHLAAAVGTPVVSIFTRNQPGINPERWRPYSSNSRVVSIPLNQDLSFQKAGEISTFYLELIKPQEVFSAVDALFKLC
jgi:heptosyltransferase-2